jgi:hypothetical protein
MACGRASAGASLSWMRERTGAAEGQRSAVGTGPAEGTGPARGTGPTAPCHPTASPPGRLGRRGRDLRGHPGDHDDRAGRGIRRGRPGGRDLRRGGLRGAGRTAQLSRPGAGDQRGGGRGVPGPDPGPRLDDAHARPADRAVHGGRHQRAASRPARRRARGSGPDRLAHAGQPGVVAEVRQSGAGRSGRDGTGRRCRLAPPAQLSR